MSRKKEKGKRKKEKGKRKKGVGYKVRCFLIPNT
jgi:hypothetical protein